MTHFPASWSMVFCVRVDARRHVQGTNVQSKLLSLAKNENKTFTENVTVGALVKP
jgi:hypothetical protein